MQQLLNEAEVIVDSLIDVGQSSDGVRDELVANLGNFCPNDPNFAQSVGQDLDTLASEAISLLNELGDFINNEVIDLGSSIDATQKTTNDIERIVNEIDVNDWQSLLVIIPYILVPSLLLVGVMMAWFDASISIYQCVVIWFINPLFIVLTAIATVGCAAVSWLAVMNAGT